MTESLKSQAQQLVEASEHAAERVERRLHAKGGTLTERAEASLKAGCDLVVHWNGDMDEMQQVAAGVGKLKGKSARRADAALARIVQAPEPLDVVEARARFDRLMTPYLEAKAGPDVGEAQG